MFAAGISSALAYEPARGGAELPNLNVNATAQDEDGFVWIATSNGLCKSLGNEYDIYFGDSDDLQTVTSNHILNLYVDSDGWLMVATSRGISGLEKGTRIFHRYTFENMDGAEICSYGFVEFAGELLCYGSSGIYAVNKDEGIMRLRYLVEGSSVTNAIKDDNGRLWLAAGHDLLALDSAYRTCDRLSLDNSYIIKSIAYSGDRFVLGTNQGLLFFNPSTRMVSRAACKHGGEPHTSCGRRNYAPFHHKQWCAGL